MQIAAKYTDKATMDAISSSLDMGNLRSLYSNKSRVNSLQSGKIRVEGASCQTGK